jgi:D-alanyl-D-alanine dipeptidase
LNAVQEWLRAIVNKPAADRRSEPRTPYTASISVRNSSGTVFRGVARDLSPHGLGAVVFAHLRPGDPVVIKYAHPHKPTADVIDRHGMVRSSHGYRYGFEFEQAMAVDLDSPQS